MRIRMCFICQECSHIQGILSIPRQKINIKKEKVSKENPREVRHTWNREGMYKRHVQVMCKPKEQGRKGVCTVMNIFNNKRNDGRLWVYSLYAEEGAPPRVLCHPVMASWLLVESWCCLQLFKVGWELAGDQIKEKTVGDEKKCEMSAINVRPKTVSDGKNIIGLSVNYRINSMMQLKYKLCQ